MDNPQFQVMRHPDGALAVNVGAGAVDWSKVLQFLAPIIIALLQQWLQPKPPVPTPPAP